VQQPETPRSPESIADAIEQDIIAKGWPVGTVYATQVDLEQRFGVSRTVLREATRILEEHRVLVPRRGRNGGLVVTAPDHHTVARSVALLLSYQKLSVAELEEIREPLELLAVRLATERLTPEYAARLREVVTAETAEPYEVGIGQAQPNFHMVLAEAADNRALQMFAEVTTSAGRHKAALLGQTGHSTRIIAQHADIAAAVLAGDTALAEEHMRAHLRLLRELGL
jgi:DNA-binding FadR family transcriptional regulator